MQRDKEYILAGVLMKAQLSAADTGGSLTVLENRSLGPSKTPIHVHAHEDETLYMLEGEMLAYLEGQERTISAGQSIFMPRGIPHQLANASGKPARYLLLCTPSGFEDFIERAGRVRASNETPRAPSPEEIQRLVAIAPEFGITILASW